MSNPAFNEEHPMIKENVPLHEVNVWPEEEKHPGFREYHESYFNKCYEVAKVTLRAIALALEKDEYFLINFFEKKIIYPQLHLFHTHMKQIVLLC